MPHNLKNAPIHPTVDDADVLSCFYWISENDPDDGMSIERSTWAESTGETPVLDPVANMTADPAESSSREPETLMLAPIGRSSPSMPRRFQI